MTPAQARESLLLHSFQSDAGNPAMETGFLGSLRPYRGLREENFHEVITALQVLEPELREEKVDSRVMSALWWICGAARRWGVHPDGMLRGNNLISEADVSRLESWIDAIEYAVMCLLDGTSSEEAFAEYEQLLAGNDEEES